MAAFDPSEGTGADPVGAVVRELLGDAAYQRWQASGAQGLTLTERGVVAEVRHTAQPAARAELEADGGAAQVAWETFAGSGRDLRAIGAATPELIRNLVLLAGLVLLLRRS